MTGTATFGDFAAAASNHLARAVSLTDPVATSRSGAGRVTQAADIRRGMSRVITVISRYVADITASTARVRPDQHEVLTPWARAAVEAARALKEASALLAPDGGRVFGSNMRPSASAAGQGFDAAISFMTAGRDLLHTHLSADLDGIRVYRSEWAPVIVSVPVTGALMLEFAQWAQISATGGLKAAEVKPPREHRISDSIETLVAQRRLEAASRALLKVDVAVHRAQRRQPVSSADVGLLHAIRANVIPAHRLPVGWESVADLCRGTTETAERARHIARVVVPDALWSPLLTGDSLRETAASATAVSHHCSIVLRILGARAAQQGSAAVSAGLFQSAAAAERARDAWLRAATMWNQLTTETRGVTSPVAAETANLALWTGRLAFADATWTLAKGPTQPARPLESLAPTPSDLPGVVAAAHQACDALVQLAAADHQQVSLAAQAGRLHSPTRSLSDDVDIPHPFGRTPTGRVSLVLDAYRQAGQASARTTAALSAVAQAVRAPSTTLTAARAAARASRAGLGVDGAIIDPRPADVERASARITELPGHFERILSDLGVTDPAILARASAIDLAGEELIIESGREANAGSMRIAQCAPAESPATTALVRAAEPGATRQVVARPIPALEAEAEL